jgi:hypothetical protein
MAKINYKCNSCGYRFEGDEYTLDCPSCGETEISQTKGSASSGGIVNWIKNHKLIAAIIGVLVLFLLIFTITSSGDESVNNIEPTNGTSLSDVYTLIFDKKDNYIQVKIKNKSNPKAKTDYSHNKTLFVLIQLKAIQANEKVSLIEDRIYPCNNGPVKITWNKAKQLSNKTTEKTIDFKFEDGVSKSDKANCREPLEIHVIQGDSCNIIISTNYDTLYPDKTVLISIEGKDGIYLNKRGWYCKKGKKVITDTIRVFGYVDGYNDTIASIDNGEKFRESGCFFVDPTVVVKAINNYANDPASFSKLKAFKRHANKVKIYYLGKYYGVGINGISKIENIIRTEKMNNNTKFNARISKNPKTHEVVKVDFVKQ